MTNFRFPSDSPESKARLARAIARERAASAPKTTRGTPFEEHLRAIGHPAAKWDYDSGVVDLPATPPQDPRAQEQAALVPEWNDGKPTVEGLYEVRLQPAIDAIGLAYYYLDGLWSGWNSREYWEEKGVPTDKYRTAMNGWQWRIPESPLPTPAERAQSGIQP